MNRLRTLANDYLLPLVISALVLRALIPAGFMPGTGEGLSLTAAMCNAPSTGAPRAEIIEIPGADAPMTAAVMHCDFCLVPVLGAAFASPALQASERILSVPLPARADAPVSRFALSRAQIPRAPPLA
ncbi:MAG: hypothetical protein K0Q92_55 [Steroidobacteraceae bacterium]|nr:hypothetical protein [Steroidobacteraceae bacterium]